MSYSAHARGFRDRRHAGHGRGAFPAGHAQSAQLAGLDVIDEVRGGVEHHRDAPAQEVGHRGGAALVRHMDHVDVGQALEQLAGQVARRAVAGRREGQFTRLLACERDEFGNGRGLDAGVHHQHVRRAVCQRDRLETGQGVVAQRSCRCWG